MIRPLSARVSFCPRRLASVVALGVAGALGCSGEVDGPPVFPDAEPTAQPTDDNSDSTSESGGDGAAAPVEVDDSVASNDAPAGAGDDDDADDDEREDDDDDRDDDADDDDADDDDADDDDADDDDVNAGPVDPTLGDVTFTSPVRDILVQNCGRCHAAGNLPNFASANADTGYSVASREGEDILEQISEGSMPADTCGGGAPGDSGCVSVADFEALRAWVAADTPE